MKQQLAHIRDFCEHIVTVNKELNERESELMVAHEIPEGLRNAFATVPGHEMQGKVLMDVVKSAQNNLLGRQSKVEEWKSLVSKLQKKENVVRGFVSKALAGIERPISGSLEVSHVACVQVVPTIFEIECKSGTLQGDTEQVEDWLGSVQQAEETVQECRTALTTANGIQDAILTMMTTIPDGEAHDTFSRDAKRILTNNCFERQEELKTAERKLTALQRSLTALENTVMAAKSVAASNPHSLTAHS